MESIPVTLQSDEKGYFDRECLNANCHYQFKIKMKDWKEKASDTEIHCPMCGHVDSSDKWWTQEQLAQLTDIATSYALNYIQGEINKSFGKLAKSTRNNKFIKITYKPGKRVSFTNNPIGQMPEWEQEITCEKCGTTFSVIGSAYFCPCCGYNSASSAFKESMDSVGNMIESLEQMKALYTSNYGADKADTMCRSMLEGSLGDCVSAFQKFAQCRYKEMTAKNVRVNDFQIVEKGSNLFSTVLGYGYEKWLNETELSILKLFFQRRHLFEHNNGMVDQQYLKNSGDITYKVGQRVVLKVSEVQYFILLLKKLGEGLLNVNKVTLDSQDT